MILFQRRVDRPLLFGATALCALASSSSAQFNDAWATFAKDAAYLNAGTIADSNNEVDLIEGDLDRDGWIDLVVVRKQPFTSTGKRTNILLRNINGVLTDKTSLYASASDVGGDSGFLTPTNDRDVILADVDGDGWDDVITATTISDGDPKHIGHPRVYRNLGSSLGVWQGLLHEDGRFPQLLHFGTGNPENPRFCSVAAGDLTGNGVPDLFFGDYDSSGAGGSQQGSNEDMNDRCLINDGLGFFADESQSRCTSSMLLSAFGMATEIHDVNLDGTMDVIKDSALNSPQNVRVLYNNPNNVGVFNLEHVVHTNQPYHIDVGDLNNDGRPDLVATDDASDRFRLNTGVDPLGRATWTSAKVFSFLSGGDDGFGSNNLIADIDGDGWNDVLIADVDVDIGGYTRRLHIYHNRGGTPGTTNLTLREERQSSGSGWVGVVGMTTNDMRGTHDMVVFDVDNDGDNDMFISRRDSTDVWVNQFDWGPTGTAFGTGTSAPSGVPEFRAINVPTAGSGLYLAIEDLTPGSFAYVAYAVAQKDPPLDLSSGLLFNVSLPFLLLSPTVADEYGRATTWVNVPGAASGISLYSQAFALDGQGANTFASSRGLRLDIP